MGRVRGKRKRGGSNITLLFRNKILKGSCYINKGNNSSRRYHSCKHLCTECEGSGFHTPTVKGTKVQKGANETIMGNFNIPFLLI